MPIIMSAGFFWTVIAIAFAVGFGAASSGALATRREHRAQAEAAAKLLADVAATLRAARSPLPMALHRRVCDFRARVGL